MNLEDSSVRLMGLIVTKYENSAGNPTPHRHHRHHLAAVCL